MKKIRDRLRKIFEQLGKSIIQLIDKWKAGWSAESANGTSEGEAEDTPYNPWIYATREVIEQIGRAHV